MDTIKSTLDNAGMPAWFASTDPRERTGYRRIGTRAILELVGVIALAIVIGMLTLP